MTDWVNSHTEWATEQEAHERFLDETVMAPIVIMVPAAVIDAINDIADYAWYMHVLECPKHTLADKIYAMQELERLEAELD